MPKNKNFSVFLRDVDKRNILLGKFRRIGSPMYSFMVNMHKYIYIFMCNITGVLKVDIRVYEDV